jgi:hypothetical protein
LDTRLEKPTAQAKERDAAVELAEKTLQPQAAQRGQVSGAVACGT